MNIFLFAIPLGVAFVLVAALATALYRLRQLHFRFTVLEKKIQGIGELKKRLLFYEKSLHFNLAPVCITDPTDGIFFANNAFLKMVGKPAEQVLGREMGQIFTWEESVAEQQRVCIPDDAHQHILRIQYDMPQHTEQQRRTGMLRTLLLQDDAEHPLGKVHLFWDVTECLRLQTALRESQTELEAKVAARTQSQAQTNEELKKVIHQLESGIAERRTMQAALEENEKRLSLIIESTEIGLWDWRPLTGEMVVNERWAAIAGYRLEELAPISSQTWKNLCRQEDVKKAEKIFLKHQRGSTTHYEQQMRLRHKGGHWIWVQVRGKIVERDAQENPARIVGTIVDISKPMETRERLLHSLSEFEAIFENSQVGFIYLKNNRKIARVNAKFSELTGYESWELIGESTEIFYGTREEFFEFDQKYSEKLKEDGIMHLEYDFHRKDGKLLPCLISGKAVDPYDPAKGVIWIVEDLIQLQQAKTQLNRQSALLAALIDSLPDFVLYKDLDGVFMGCNKAFCQEAKLAREEIIGRTDYDLLPLETALQVREKDRLVLESRKAALEEEDIQLFDDTLREFEILRTPFYGPSNTLLGLIVLVRDIAERRRSEKLAKDVEQMVRHDIKTPLNVVIALPQLLLKNPDLDQKERERYLRTINKSGLLMLDLINRSLDIFKMETGSYTLAPVPFDMVATIEKVVEDCGLQAKNTEVGLVFETKAQCCTVMGEELLYYTMLANVIKNAIEATPSEGIVRISLRCGEQVHIECNNPGMVPPELHASFFDKFATHKKSGTGLGTYSARLIVELHQGVIKMRSSKEEGTTVVIDIPTHPQGGDPDKPRLY